MTKCKLAIPNKGRMNTAVLELLNDAGLHIKGGRHDRALVAQLGDDFEALFVRSSDIANLVNDGVVDAGITGWDLVNESGCDLVTALDLGIGECSLIVAAPTRCGYQQVDDLPDGARIATSFPNMTARYFAEHDKNIEIVPVSGAAEIAPQLGIADAIVDLVSTGSTLMVNGLQQIALILESTARLVTRPQTAPGTKVQELVVALHSVLEAKNKRYLMANVQRSKMTEVRRIMPGINGPTVVDVAGDPERVAVHAVVDEHAVYHTIAELKALDAEGILVTRIERLMP